MQKRVPMFCDPDLHCLRAGPQPCELTNEGLLREDERFLAWIQRRELQRRDLIHLFHELGRRMRSCLRSGSLNKGLEGGELGMRAHFLRELHAKTMRRSDSQREPHTEARGGATANDPARARLCVAREVAARETLAAVQRATPPFHL